MTFFGFDIEVDNTNGDERRVQVRIDPKTHELHIDPVDLDENWGITTSLNEFTSGLRAMQAALDVWHDRATT